MGAPPTSGLEGVIAAETRLSSVDGLKGELIIAGFPVEVLAPNATFEETLFLLWNDRLPTQSELQDFRASLGPLRRLPPVTVDLLRAAAREKVPVIDALRMGAATLSLGQPAAQGGTANLLAQADKDARRVVAAFPTIVATYWRLLAGQAPVEPDASLDHATNYLWMLRGVKPTKEQARGLETYLNTVSDHGLNASTFTARVIISTQSDMVSALTGAIGALKGPLHGGAPGPALELVFEIGREDNIDNVLRAKLSRGERLMGFGHRVYKTRDPRAEVLSQAAKRFYEAGGDLSLYTLTRAVEKRAVALLDEYKPGRNLRANVEFYTALLLHGLKLEIDLFTPTFAVGRSAGWTAHAFEQIRLGKLIRPQSRYTGERGRAWVPIEKR
ncbi:MAG: citrate synthase [Thermoplasmatota archaeon]